MAETAELTVSPRRDLAEASRQDGRAEEDQVTPAERSGIKDTGRDAINRNQKMGDKPSKGGSIKNGKGGLPGRNAIDENTGKEWPTEGKVLGQDPNQFAVQGPCAEAGRSMEVKIRSDASKRCACTRALQIRRCHWTDLLAR